VMPRSVSARHIIQTVSDLAFSARYALARGRSVVSLYGLASKSKAQRREGFRTLFGTVLSTASVIALVAALKQALGDDDDDDMEVSLNPFSADFLKVKIGNTRMDLLSGETQWVRFFSRFMFAKTVNSRTGKIEDIERGRVLSLFLASKQAPIISLGRAAVLQEGFAGRKLETAKDWAEVVSPVPLWIQDGVDVFNDQINTENKDAWEAMLISSGAFGAAWLGQGIQTYDVNGGRGLNRSSSSYSPPTGVMPRRITPQRVMPRVVPQRVMPQRRNAMPQRVAR